MALHTDIPTRAELGSLLGARDPASVSIYLPTSVVTQEARANRIELKGLASDAVRQLEDAGAERRAVGHVRDALDDVVDDEGFWTEQAHSLAVFASPERLRTFRLPNRLTAAVVDEIVRRVLLSDGRVLAVRAPDVPGGGAVAAILRYAL